MKRHNLKIQEDKLKNTWKFWNFHVKFHEKSSHENIRKIILFEKVWKLSLENRWLRKNKNRGHDNIFSLIWGEILKLWNPKIGMSITRRLNQITG